VRKIWEELEIQSDFKKTLPVIVPFIVYHCRRSWKTSNSMKQSFAIISGAESFVPDFMSIVVDLSLLDENIRR
jgi:hypothetical protein